MKDISAPLALGSHAKKLNVSKAA